MFPMLLPPSLGLEFISFSLGLLFADRFPPPACFKLPKTAPLLKDVRMWVLGSVNCCWEFIALVCAEEPLEDDVELLAASEGRRLWFFCWEIDGLAWSKVGFFGVFWSCSTEFLAVGASSETELRLFLVGFSVLGTFKSTGSVLFVGNECTEVFFNHLHRRWKTPLMKPQREKSASFSIIISAISSCRKKQRKNRAIPTALKFLGRDRSKNTD